MKKSELVNTLSEKFTMSHAQTERAVETLLLSMTDALAAGGRVEIRGFGSLECRTYKARQGRNPQTGASVEVAAKKLPRFKMGKDLKESL